MVRPFSGVFSICLIVYEGTNYSLDAGFHGSETVLKYWKQTKNKYDRNVHFCCVFLWWFMITVSKNEAVTEKPNFFELHFKNYSLYIHTRLKCLSNTHKKILLILKVREQLTVEIVFTALWLMKDAYLAIEIPTVIFLSPTCGYTVQNQWYSVLAVKLTVSAAN